MKILHALLSAIVLVYLLQGGTCGTIKAEADIKNEEEAIVETKESIFEKLFHTLIDGYEAATQILHDLLHKEDDKGILESLYEKLKEELAKLKDYILGGKPLIAEEVELVRRTVERIVEEHKRIHATSKVIVEGALDRTKNSKLAQKIVNEGPDLVRHRVYEIDRALKEHVFDGPRTTLDHATNDINDAENSLKSSVNFLQEQGLKLTDPEKEVLDRILRRIHESLLIAKEHAKEQH